MLSSQYSFASGEIAPALRSRSDTVKYQTGLSTCRNMFVRRSGGVSSRPGTKYVGESRSHGTRVRLVPFVFSNDQAYVIEFGHQYIRFIYQGAYVTEDALSVDGVSIADPCVITVSAGHGYISDEDVLLRNIAGTTVLSNGFFKVNYIDATTFSLEDMTGRPFSTLLHPAYTGGGTVEKVYQLRIPPVDYYDEDELDLLTFTQSADVMTICHPAHPPRELSRNSHASWSFASKSFGSALSVPTSLDVGDLSSATPREYAYVMTAVNDLGDESLPSAATFITDYQRDTDAIAESQVPNGVSTDTWQLELDGGGSAEYFNGSIGGGAPPLILDYGVLVTVTSTNSVDWSTSARPVYVKIMGQTVDGIAGSEEFLGPAAGCTVTGTLYWRQIDHIYFYSPAGTGIDSGGVEVGIAGVRIFPHAVSCAAVTGATRYRLYRGNLYGTSAITPAYGFVGESTSENGVIDEGGAPDITRSFPEQLLHDGFDDPGEYPGAVGYYQQRMILGGFDGGSGLLVGPETNILSRTGLYDNFLSSVPVTASGAISFNVFGRRVNRVRHYLDLGRLIIFTEDGEWYLEGDSAGIVSPTQINPRQISYCGIGNLPPIAINNTALFVQRGGRSVRDISFELQSNGYQGNDLAVFSSHLLDGYSVVDWTYQSVPDSLVWLIRDDGTMLSLTYLREHQIYGWARHDAFGTDAKFISACSVPNPEGTDDLYVMVRRTILGRDFMSLEMMSDRHVLDDMSLICTDDTLTYDGRCEHDPNPVDGSTLGLWRLDEDDAADDAIDSSGNYHPGRQNGSPAVDDGIVDGSRQCDDNVYFDLGDAPDAFETQAFTWCGWFRMDLAAGAGALMNKLETDSPGFAYRLSVVRYSTTETYDLVGEIGLDDTTTDTVQTTTHPVLGRTWHHAGMTWDGEYLKLYLDGQLVDSSNAADGKTIFYSGSYNYQPRLGGWNESTDEHFNGRIDHWRFHDEAKDGDWFEREAAGCPELTISARGAEVWEFVNANSGNNVVTRPQGTETWEGLGISGRSPAGIAGHVEDDGTRHVFVLDTNGYLHESVDGGAWTQLVQFTYSTTWGGICCVDEDNVWGSSAGNYVHHWNRTGGLTSYEVTADTNYKIEAAWAVDNSTIVAVARWNDTSNTWKIYKSTDGGSSWVLQQTISPSGDKPAYCLFSPDGVNFYLGSKNGGIYSSSDSGATWAEDGGFVDAGIRDVLGIWGTSSTDIWAVAARTVQGDSDIGHLTESGWTTYSKNSTDSNANNNGFAGVWGANTSEIWFAQYNSDVAVVFDGSTWTEEDIGASGVTSLRTNPIWSTEYDASVKYDTGSTLRVLATTDFFESTHVGNEIHFTADDGTLVKFTIVTYVDSRTVTGTADVDIPADLQGQSTANWAMAIDTITGLIHLEGLDVDVYADDEILASQLNSDYSTITVSSGAVTLPRAVTRAHIGLPVVNDIETLDMVHQAQELRGEKKLTTRVALNLERSSRCYVGTDNPGDDTSLTDLEYFDILGDAGTPNQSGGEVTLVDGVAEVEVTDEWNRQARVMVRNVDPVPLSVLAVTRAVATAPRRHVRSKR